MPTTKPRPTRLVASQRRAAASKAVTAINSEHSPFLKLAPELRNRIYELVIGGHVIHVGEKSKPARFCSEAFDNASIKAKYKSNPRMGAYDCRYFRDHMNCTSGYNMPLLRVCRQINEETALLPFATNTFMVKVANLSTFIGRLLPQQRKAIKSLQLNLELFRLTELDGAKMKQLTSLRDLTIALPGLNHESRGTAPQLMKLANGRLQSVAVLITWRPLYWVARYDPDEWSARMEEQLKVRNSLTERNKMAAKARAELKEALEAEKDRKKEQAAQASAATRERRGLRKLR